MSATSFFLKEKRKKNDVLFISHSRKTGQFYKMMRNTLPPPPREFMVIVLFRLRFQFRNKAPTVPLYYITAVQNWPFAFDENTEQQRRQHWSLHEAKLAYKKIETHTINLWNRKFQRDGRGVRVSKATSTPDTSYYVVAIPLDALNGTTVTRPVYCYGGREQEVFAQYQNFDQFPDLPFAVILNSSSLLFDVKRYLIGARRRHDQPKRYNSDKEIINDEEKLLEFINSNAPSGENNEMDEEEGILQQNE
ncbi:MAG TPA: hypothetical protein VJL60_04310, partial [Gammaproteobacteria bacterium]|nr:hypothetical protein [Gammaproteobacteria bacterium]